MKIKEKSVTAVTSPQGHKQRTFHIQGFKINSSAHVVRKCCVLIRSFQNLDNSSMCDSTPFFSLCNALFAREGAPECMCPFTY